MRITYKYATGDYVHIASGDSTLCLVVSRKYSNKTGRIFYILEIVEGPFTGHLVTANEVELEAAA